MPSAITVHPGDEEAQDAEIVSSEVIGPGALAAINRSEIDVQIATAKKFPRSITKFKQQALEMATLDEDTAEAMGYALPRKDKAIEGPTVRFAEIVASAWGNLRVGSRIIDIGDTYVTAQGFAFDLERNLARQTEVKRRITDKYGHRYNEDMIGVTCNAGCAIAERNAILRTIPGAYTQPIYKAAMKVAEHASLTMEQRRKRAFDWYATIKATEKDVLALLGRPSVEEVAIEDLTLLQGLKTAITDGEATFADALAARTGKLDPTTPTGMPARKSGRTVAGVDLAVVPGTDQTVTTEVPLTTAGQVVTAGSPEQAAKDDVWPSPEELAAEEAARKAAEAAPAPASAPAPTPPPLPAQAPAPRASDTLKVTKSASVSLPKSKGGGTAYEITFSDGKTRTSKDIAIYRAAAAAEEGEYGVVCVFDGDVVRLISKAKK